MNHKTFSSRSYNDLGVKNGSLAPCKPSHNGVSTQSLIFDDEHYMEPIELSEPFDKKEVMEKVKDIVSNTPRTTIIAADDTYLRAKYKSAVPGLYSDVEFYLSELEELLHFRSVSHFGLNDFGGNRKKMESFRERFSK